MQLHLKNQCKNRRLKNIPLQAADKDAEGVLKIQLLNVNLIV